MILSPHTFFQFGCSAEHLPLSFREKVALDREKRRLVRLLMQEELGGELMVLSTCNRTEVLALLPGFGAEWNDTDLTTLFRRVVPGAEALDLSDIRIHRGVQAISRLFSLASGLESPLLGEVQIQTQIRDQFVEARADATAGSRLGRIINSAIACARQTRQTTHLGRHRHGTPRIATEWLRSITPDAPVIAILGRGDLAAQMARRIRQSGPARILSIHRCPAKARNFSETIGASPHTLSELDGLLPTLDALIAAAPTGLHALLPPPHNVTNLKIRAVLDLAVPRTLHPSWGHVTEGAEFHDMETLVAAATAAQPPADSPEVCLARTMVSKAVDAFVERHTHSDSETILPVSLHSDTAPILTMHRAGLITDNELVERIARVVLESSTVPTTTHFVSHDPFSDPTTGRPGSR